MRQNIVLLLATLTLGAAIFLVYMPAASGPFILDDLETIVENPSIQQLWPLVDSDREGGPLNPPDTSPTHGRPLVNLAMAANYHFGGLDPFGYRIVHFVLHFATALLLWALVAETLRLDYFHGKFDTVAGPLAFASAFVWALHPVHTETLLYVTQRTELMMGLFYLATLYLSLRYWAAERTAWRAAYLALASMACTSGMLCKEMMASAPAMVLLYERTFLTGSFRRSLRRSWPLYMGLALAWVPVILLNLDGAKTPGAGFGKGLTAFEWWFTQTKVLFLYLKLAVWPWPLLLHYEIPYEKSLSTAWPWLLAAGSLAIATVVLVWRRSAIGFVAVWVVAVLSPTLVIPLVGETAAERRMYIPLAALVPLLIVAGYWAQQRLTELVARRAGKVPVRRVSLALLSAEIMALGLTFACLTHLHLRAYEDELSLWQDVADHQPNDPLAQLNVGTLLAERGRNSEAVEHLKEAARLAPDPRDSPVCYDELMRYRAHYNLARVLENSGRFNEAIHQYRATLKLRPDDATTHYNLARLLENMNDIQQAEAHYRQAIAADPDFAAAHSNLGILLQSAGRVPEAIESFEAALRSQETMGNCLNLATAYCSVGREPEAIPLLEKSLLLAHTPNELALTGRVKAMLAQLRSQQRVR